MIESCPTCGNSFSSIGQHWRMSDCPYPNLSNYQHRLVSGLLLGDGSLNNRGGRPRLVVNSITEPYLDYLRDQFGVMGTGVKKVSTAKEQSERLSEYNGNGNVEDYHDVYRFSTRKIPALKPYSKWYSTGEKRFPETLGLDPTTLKHWYVGDGTFVNHDGKNHVMISTVNERDRTDAIEKLFTTAGFEIGWWEDHSFCLSSTDTKQFFDYIGDPLPGFRHKWPDDN
jgi:hypothetical protein